MVARISPSDSVLKLAEPRFAAAFSSIYTILSERFGPQVRASRALPLPSASLPLSPSRDQIPSERGPSELANHSAPVGGGGQLFVMASMFQVQVLTLHTM